MSDVASRDDLEARSGSATALLRTVVGNILRPIGGWMSAAGAVRLMGDLGVPPATARSSLARLCSRGVLRREPRSEPSPYRSRLKRRAAQERCVEWCDDP